MQECCVKTQIISALDSAISRRILLAIARKPELCREVCEEVSRNRSLQKRMLETIADRPAAVRQFILYLIRRPRIRGKILKLAGQAAAQTNLLSPS
jgi:hypothetical protein